MTKSKTYRSWQAANSRCHNPNDHKYQSYGARGIEMCLEWRGSFEKFLADMGQRPEGMTLDRVDQTLGYVPGNCRWATYAEQARERGNIRCYKWRGGWFTLTEIGRLEGVPRGTLTKALKRNRTIQEAVADAKSRKREFRGEAA